MSFDRRIPAGAARHTVAVLEPHPAFDIPRMPMIFDIGLSPLVQWPILLPIMVGACRTLGPVLRWC